MKNNELRPCPFCGCDAMPDGHDGAYEYSPGEWVLNHFCGSGDSPSNITFYATTREGCVNAWNQRPIRAKKKPPNLLAQMATAGTNIL